MLQNSIDMESTNTKVRIFSELKKKNTFSPNAKPWAQWTP